MHEDNIDLGVGMGVYLGDFEAFDVVKIDSGALCSHVIVSLVCSVQYSTPIGFACTYHACALFSVLCLYLIRCIRPGRGNSSGSLYTTADLPYYCVMIVLRVHQAGRRGKL